MSGEKGFTPPQSPQILIVKWVGNSTTLLTAENFWNVLEEQQPDVVGMSPDC